MLSSLLSLAMAMATNMYLDEQLRNAWLAVL
jgi:hypothetical protein